VSILDLDREFWRNHIPVPREASEALEPLRQSGLTARAAAATEPFAVPDVSEDERCSEDAYLVSRGIQAYAVAPLRTHSGHAVGLLCVFDTKPRQVTRDDLRKMRAVADRLMEVAESRALQTA
jgi:GAF domain-containing protein